MSPPKMTKSAEEVERDYQRRLDDRGECTGLSHVIDSGGSCQCGFFIDGKPGGTFGSVPNRATRRRITYVVDEKGKMHAIKTPYKKGRYVLTDEDKQRMEEEREADDKRRETRRVEREARRALRAKLGFPERDDKENQPALSVDLLVGAEEGQSEDGESQVD